MAFSPIRFVDKDKDKAFFFSTLRKRVDGYFKENNISKHYNSTMVIKTIVVLAAYILPFIYILAFNPSFKIALILWAIMGFALSGVGMSVMHDANHGAYATSHKVNYWLGHTLNLLGGSVFNWKLQHNVMHHTYTNIIDYDDDIADKLILKFNPHTQVKWYHKLQFIYAFFFYGYFNSILGIIKRFYSVS
jgi:linoleoyl-CoA desaturase